MGTSAKIIADSYYENGTRLTTFELTIHRFVLSEFNTHRILNKNSASSRAIPVWKQIERVRTDPAIPLKFPLEQKGMQGGDALQDSATAEEVWLEASKVAADYALELSELGVHKSVTNRILEPYLWHTIVCTGTSFQNFFNQRVSPLAQPEIAEVATLMLDAYSKSVPKELPSGGWHTPYIENHEVDSVWTAVKASAARCARVSYETQDGKRDVEADLALYSRLTTAEPPHWSPLEHVATPWSVNRQDGILPFSPVLDVGSNHAYVQKSHLPKIGNLLGWRSLRTEVEASQRILTAV